MAFLPALSGCSNSDAVGEACEIATGDLVITEIMANPTDNCSSYTSAETCEAAVPACNWSVSTTRECDGSTTTTARCTSTDSEREWFEVYNASAKSLLLDRVVLQRATLTGCGPYLCRQDDCPAGQGPCSEEGRCRELVICANDTECPAGQTCDECHLCRCHAAKKCRTSRAAQHELECAEDDTCRCHSDDDCPEVGEHCAADGLCSCDTCSSDAECPSGLLCGDDGRCQATSVTRHNLRQVGVAAPSTYLVFGDGVVGRDLVDYSYGGSEEGFGALSNTSAQISLWCKGSLIDAVWYGRAGSAPSPQPAVSLELDGRVAPDEVLNDHGDFWCSASGSTYDALGLNVGSPGAANPTVCGKGVCDDRGAIREVVAPRAGELIITEVFADATGADDGKEWLEVHSLAAGAIDLNGLAVYNQSSSGGSERSTMITASACVTIETGAYLIIAASADSASNGNLPAVGVTVDGLSLFNGGLLELRRGGELIDVARFPETDEGVSVSLDPLAVSAGANDLESAFCPGGSDTLFDGRGTPGQSNDPCGNACRDGGALRPVSWPAAGELVITEVYADPVGTDASRDWLEVYVASSTTRDVNGLTVESQGSGSPRVWQINEIDCVPVVPQSYVVLGGVNATSDGVSPAATFGGADETLLLSTPSRLTIKAGSTVVDEIDQFGDPRSGRALALDPAVLDAGGNDLAASWCEASETGNFGSGTQTGSPGLANTTDCP